LLGQKKETKEKAAPHTANFLRFSPLSRVFRTGFPALRKTRGILAAPHSGSFSTKAPMLGAV
jgi:hypothetical protein